MTQKDDEHPKRISNGLTLSLISILIMVNIMIRYPTTPHEIGWDSYVIHSLVGSIIERGQAVWILHPLSYFGMYPMSYPSGIPFLISSFSQLSGLSIEGAIWTYNVLLGILAALGTFMFAGVFKRDFWFQYLAALLFSTSMGLLMFTTWTLSTRGTLVVLTPLFLWLFIKASRELEFKFIIASFIMLFSMATIHKMFVLVIPFAMLYVMTKMLVKIKLKVKSNTLPSKHKRYRNLSAMIFLSCLIFLFLSPLFGGFGEVYNIFLKIDQLDEILIYGIGVFARNLGPVALFSLFGIVLLAKKRGKNKHEIFILGSLAIISPMMLIGKYIAISSLIFFIILAAYGLLLFYRITPQRKKMFFTVTSIVLAISLAMSCYGQISKFNILSEDNPIDERYLEIEGYDSAVWLKQNDVWVIVGSSQVVLRISAISDVSHFPGQGSTQLVYDFAYPSDMVLETRSLFDIKFYTDSPIIDTERIDEWIIWGNYDINRRPIEDIRVQRYINQFNIETLVINNYDDTHSVFTDSVMQTSYCTFNNQKVKCFYI